MVTIREVVHGDIAALQRNCFSAATVEQTTDMVESALRRSAEGEATIIVAAEDDEAFGNVTVSRNAHRLERHRAHLGGSFIPACKALGPHAVSRWLRLGGPANEGA